VGETAGIDKKNEEITSLSRDVHARWRKVLRNPGIQRDYGQRRRRHLRCIRTYRHRLMSLTTMSPTRGRTMNADDNDLLDLHSAWWCHGVGGRNGSSPTDFLHVGLRTWAVSRKLCPVISSRLSIIPLVYVVREHVRLKPFVYISVVAHSPRW